MQTTAENKNDNGMMSERFRQLLEPVIDPNTGRSIVASRTLQGVRGEKGQALEVLLRFGYYPDEATLHTLTAEIQAILQKAGESDTITIKHTVDVVAHSVQRGLKPLPGVKNIIAVASGKGGVGKSTTAVNLALALSCQGARVGLLDADIYGPSQPQMVGLSGQQPESEDGESMSPLMAYGLQTMSIGYMIDQDTPMVWRGPMVMQALNQLITQTRWDDLDYLIVDMPPGTGDTQLTLAQKVPVTGAVIVTTPQDIALLDAKKGLKMFEKVGIPILGLIENMAIHVCSQCGHEEHIFGVGGGQSMSEQYGVELLGSLPLERAIREMADGGRPTVVGAPESPAARLYHQIALKLAAGVAARSRDMSSRFPNIVVAS